MLFPNCFKSLRSSLHLELRFWLTWSQVDSAVCFEIVHFQLHLEVVKNGFDQTADQSGNGKNEIVCSAKKPSKYK